MKPKNSTLLTWISSLSIACSISAQAVDVIKANNTSDLNLSGSWVSGTPSTDDVAVWNNTVTAANTVNLGGTLSWGGIKITNPSGAVSINSGGLLTLGSSGIDMSTATRDLTLNNNLILGSDQNWNVASSRALTVTGLLSGTGSLTKSGVGTLNLNAANDYSGTTILNGGTAVVASIENANVASGFGMNSSLTLSGATIQTTASGNKTSNRNFTLSGTNTLYIKAANQTLTGQLSGGGVLVARSDFSTGRLFLAGDNSFSGEVQFATDGRMTLAHANALKNATLNMTGQRASIDLVANNLAYNIGGLKGSISINLGSGGGTGVSIGGNGQSNEYWGILSGGAKLIKTGSGTQVLRNANTNAGGTTISEGTLRLDAVPAQSLNCTIASGKTLQGFTPGQLAQMFIGQSVSGTGIPSGSTIASIDLAQNRITLNSSTNPTGVTAANFGGVTGGLGSGAVTIASGATLDAASANLLVMSQAISGGGNLMKSGAGTLELTNANSFAGTTTVNEGTLKLSGSGSIAASTTIEVKQGAFLDVSAVSAFTLAGNQMMQGKGTVIGTMTVAGTLSPGSSPGTLATGSEIWSNGGDYNWQVQDAAGSAGSGYDTIAVNGTLDLSALTPGGFSLNLWTLAGLSPDANGDAINFNNASNYAWTILSTTGGLLNFEASDFSLNTGAGNGTSGFSNGLAGGAFSLTTSGDNKDLILKFNAAAAVPEPSSLILGGLGALALFRRRRSQIL